MTTIQTTTPRTRHAGRLALDLAMTVATLLLIDPRATGIAVHEWIGIALAVPVTVHLVLNWQWVVTVTKKMFGRLPLTTRVNQVLNMVLFVSFVVAMESGVMISEVVSPGLATALGGSRVWRGLHGISSTAVFGVAVAHVAMNWRWIARAVSRLLGSEPARAPRSAMATVGGR